MGQLQASCMGWQITVHTLISDHCRPVRDDPCPNNRSKEAVAFQCRCCSEVGWIKTAHNILQGHQGLWPDVVTGLDSPLAVPKGRNCRNCGPCQARLGRGQTPAFPRCGSTLRKSEGGKPNEASPTQTIFRGGTPSFGMPCQALCTA